MSTAIDRLLAIMARLRDPQRGCPWDLQQDFRSISPYTIEEAYEVDDAIAREDWPALRDELGDLLFQVVFHARLGQERGAFDFESVAAAICEKMQRRHPHVFGGEKIGTAVEQTLAWEEHKRRERAQRAVSSALDDIPRSLPALTRAAKLGKRAASVGFEWPDVAGVLDKIEEEIAELRAALAGAAAIDTSARRSTIEISKADDGLAAGDDTQGESTAADRVDDGLAAAGRHAQGARVQESRVQSEAGSAERADAAGTGLANAAIEGELGDLFFSLVNFCRHLHIDPERALRGTNRKFERRFRYVESRLAEEGRQPSQSTLAEMDGLWDEAKRSE